MDILETIGAFGNPPDWFNDIDASSGTAGSRGLAKIAWQKSQSVLATLEERFAAFEADPDLSPEGVAKKKSRAVKDARFELEKVERMREQIAAEIDSARGQYNPPPPDETTNAAVWSRLPDDPMDVARIYRDALAAGDFRTMNAIESLPVVHDGRPAAPDLAALREERFRTEAPKIAEAVDVASEAASVAENAHRGAVGFLDDLARDLPEAPDPASGISGPGPDGLRTISEAALRDVMAE